MKRTNRKLAQLVGAAVIGFASVAWAAASSVTYGGTAESSSSADEFAGTASADVYVEEGYSSRASEEVGDSGADEGTATPVEPRDVFTVTFDANGGKCVDTMRTVADGAEVGYLPEATFEGWTLVGWFTEKESGDQIDEWTVVNTDVTYYAHWAADSESGEGKWYTSRSAAIAAALESGKMIFLLCGRDMCYNTTATKASCEDPTVKAELTAKCVLWYSNCDTQEDENWEYLPWGSFDLPAVCVINPNDPDHYIKRATGSDYGGPLSTVDILAFIADIPYPSTSASSASSSPSSNSNASPSAGGVTAQYAAAKTLYGAVYDGNRVVGVVELKLGRVNARKNTSRISGAVTLLDGKKYAIKGQQAAVGGAAPLSVSLEVKKVGTMAVTIGGDRFAGTLGTWRVQTASVGGNWQASTVTVSVDTGDLSAIPGTVLESLLPYDEKGGASGVKWTFAKATSVKWTKPKAGETPVVQDAASGKGLVVDTSKGRTNLSGMKLTYAAKTGTFKGTFKVYALEGTGSSTKLKSYTMKVSGVVVDGVGYGMATCNRPAVAWPLTVQ